MHEDDFHKLVMDIRKLGLAPIEKPKHLQQRSCVIFAEYGGWFPQVYDEDVLKRQLAEALAQREAQSREVH